MGNWPAKSIQKGQENIMEKKQTKQKEPFFTKDRSFYRTFFKLMIVVALQNLIAYSVNMLDNIMLGSYSQNALSGAATVNQIFFVVNQLAISSASAVVIGKDIGQGEKARVRSDGRTLSVIDITIGIILAVLLCTLRKPLLTMYDLTEQAVVLADYLIIVMSVVMVGMSYQMPVSVGILQGGGDTKFCMYLNMISTWVIVMPLSFLAAFVWKLPVEWVVVAVQSDQLFKCIPVFLRFRGYRWMHKLT